MIPIELIDTPIDVINEQIEIHDDLIIANNQNSDIKPLIK